MLIKRIAAGVLASALIFSIGLVPEAISMLIPANTEVMTSYAEEPFNLLQDYPNSDVYVTESLLHGQIDPQTGEYQTNSVYKLGKNHKYTYEAIAEASIENPLTAGLSIVWANVTGSLKGEFKNLSQTELYEVIIMDYLMYSENVNSELANLRFRTQTHEKQTKIIDNIIDMMLDAENKDKNDSSLREEAKKKISLKKESTGINLDKGSKISLEKVQDTVKKDSKMSWIDDIQKGTNIDVFGAIMDGANTIYDFATKLAQLQALKDANDSRVEFLRKIQECASENTALYNAIEDVINKINDSFAETVLKAGDEAVNDLVVSKAVGLLTKAVPVLATINIGAGVLDVMFNSDDTAKNNINLLLIYTLGQYASTAMSNVSNAYSNSYIAYQNNKTPDTEAEWQKSAITFNTSYENYCAYQAYATDFARKYVESATTGGLLNTIKDLFNDKNNETRETFDAMFKSDSIFYDCTSFIESYRETYCNAVGIGGSSEVPIEVGETFEYDDCTYKITSIDELTVILTDCDGAKEGAVNIPESIAYKGKNFNVTEIADKPLDDYDAFSNCFHITDITIPDSVTSIGSRAFESCLELKNITIPDSVTSIGDSAFYNCPNLTTDIKIPDGVTNIGYEAFFDCSSLTNITIPDSVTSIGDSAFSGCASLESITIPDGVTSIGDFAFYKCQNLTTDIKISDGVTSIGESVFKGCSSLTNITIPDSVTSIGDSAFSGCTSLESITIPDGVTSIGDFAFYNCPNLITDIKIPDGVTSIGESVFKDCSRLTSITIPNSVTSIGGHAFEYCSSLTNIKIPDGVTSIGEYAFNDCSNLINITIPDGVTSIGECTFYDCSSLINVTIPSSVKNIGSGAFYNCSSLTDIIIPDGVTSIGLSAFEGCSSLTDIKIPDSVINIKSYAIDKMATIYGYENSTAQEYAKENGNKFVVIDSETSTTTSPATTTIATSTSTALSTIESAIVESTIPAETTTKSEYFTSIEGICEMAINDYESRTGITPVESEYVENKDGTITVYLKDADNEILDTYVIDPISGTGTNSNNEEVNLPQTGRNSLANLIMWIAAVMMIFAGGLMVFKSSRIHKKDE